MKASKVKISTQGGFSILELLVCIAILALGYSSLGLSFSKHRNFHLVQSSKQKIVSAIKQTQRLALLRKQNCSLSFLGSQAVSNCHSRTLSFENELSVDARFGNLSSGTNAFTAYVNTHSTPGRVQIESSVYFCVLTVSSKGAIRDNC